MHRRLLVALLVSVPLLVALWPGSVLAHGPIRRGLVLDRNLDRTFTTSIVTTDWQWFTMGLRPGPIAVIATDKVCRLPFAPTCGITVALYHGSRLLKVAQVACYSKPRRCGQSTRLDYTVTSSSVYYVVVAGTGGARIRFRLRVRATFYPLRCRKYC